MELFIQKVMENKLERKFTPEEINAIDRVIEQLEEDYTRSSKVAESISFIKQCHGWEELGSVFDEEKVLGNIDCIKIFCITACTRLLKELE